MEGRTVQQTETSIEVDIGAGTLTFPMSSVDRIEKGRSPLDEFDERAAALDPIAGRGALAAVGGVAVAVERAHGAGLTDVQLTGGTLAARRWALGARQHALAALAHLAGGTGPGTAGRTVAVAANR